VQKYGKINDREITSGAAQKCQPESYWTTCTKYRVTSGRSACH